MTLEQIKSEGNALMKEMLDSKLSDNYLGILGAVDGVLHDDRFSIRGEKHVELTRTAAIGNARIIVGTYHLTAPSSLPEYKKDKELTRRACEWIRKIAKLEQNEEM